MLVKVKLFAVLRERAGVSEIDLELQPGSNIAKACAELAKRFPNLGDVLNRVAYAVNQTYVKRDEPLRDGDELAFIPPVSGGSA